MIRIRKFEQDQQGTFSTESVERFRSFVANEEVSDTLISEGMKYHLATNKPILENVFRPGSEAFFKLIKEGRKLFELERIVLCDVDRELYESTDIGKFVMFGGELVPLDLPMENIQELREEAEYKGKEVKLSDEK